MTILVPVIGWVLVADDAFLKVLAKLTGYAALAEPSWRLYAFQSGLSMIGVAVALFYAACPSVITNYSDFNDFAEKDARTVTKSQVLAYEKFATQAGEPIEQYTQIDSLANPNDDSNARGIWYSRNQGDILSKQYAYYQALDHRTNNIVKIPILLLAIPGLCLSLAPTAQTVYTSLRHILSYL